ncbi:MAG: hypothetical protein K6T17_02950 [Fimbriimonadales bacterium]|nr:hypothetical protein [Fimbriimonadales bacterium]
MDVKDLRMSSGPSLRWTVHLAKEEPAKAGWVFLTAGIGGLMGWSLFGSVWMFLMGFFVVVLGTADFLLPVHYEVSQRGVRRRCGLSVTHMDWGEVRRVVVGAEGVKLSPLEKPSILSAFRGVYLLANGNIEEILACVSYWRKKYAPSVGTTVEPGT